MHQPATGTGGGGGRERVKGGGFEVETGDRFTPQGLGGSKVEEETLH